MEDITEGLHKTQEAVSNLSAVGGGRTLKFTLMDPTWTRQVEYVCHQDTLGMLPMQAFFDKVLVHVESFTKGDNAFKLGELFRGETKMPQLSGMAADDVENVVEENMALINAFLKLVKLVPELQLDVYALTLGVTRDAEWFKQAIAEPPHRGGFTIDEGFDILRVFIRQNAKEIKRFFTELATGLVEEFRTQMEAQGLDLGVSNGDTSTGGKPSNTSAQDIPASA